jgi:hypothetical protein
LLVRHLPALALTLGLVFLATPLARAAAPTTKAAPSAKPATTAMRSAPTATKTAAVPAASTFKMESGTYLMVSTDLVEKVPVVREMAVKNDGGKVSIVMGESPLALGKLVKNELVGNRTERMTARGRLVADNELHGEMLMEEAPGVYNAYATFMLIRSDDPPPVAGKVYKLEGGKYVFLIEAGPVGGRAVAQGFVVDLVVEGATVTLISPLSSDRPTGKRSANALTLSLTETDARSTFTAALTADNRASGMVSGASPDGKQTMTGTFRLVRISGPASAAAATNSAAKP